MNIERMNQLIDTIKRHRDWFDYGEWVLWDDNASESVIERFRSFKELEQEEASGHPCGTTFCVAGFAAAISSPYESMEQIWEDCGIGQFSRWLDIPYRHASAICTDYCDAEDYAISADEIIRLLGIYRDEGIDAFHAAAKEFTIDPTPWCHQCGAMTEDRCPCGPIAENN